MANSAHTRVLGIWLLVLWLAGALLSCPCLASDVCDGDCDDGICAVATDPVERRLAVDGSHALADAILSGMEWSSDLQKPQPPERRLSTGMPSEITIASFALPMSSGFLDEAALLETVIRDVNADPNMFPNTTIKALVLSEGTDIATMVKSVRDAYMQGKACASVGLLTGTRQALVAGLARVHNTNHGYYMDMELGNRPRFSEFGTTFGIFGWSQIIARLLDMVEILDLPLTRFALILPESFAAMGTRFELEQKLRGIAVVYHKIYDFRRVDVDATFADADEYAKQIIDGVVASKANLIFQCFCSTNNKHFRSQLFRRARDAGLFGPGFQWFTHYPSVIKFKEPWLYDPEYSDLWPILNHFKVIDQADYEPENYNYQGNSREGENPAFSDAVLKAKIQVSVDIYNASKANRNYVSLNWLNCSSTAHSGFKICGTTAKPGLDSKRGLKYDAIKHVLWALHEIIVQDGHHDFCDINAAGVRKGDPALFLEQLKSKSINGFSGHRQFRPIGLVGGEALTLSPTFQLMDWTPNETATRANKYVNTKKCNMHVDRFSLETDPVEKKVMRRDFATGKPAAPILWMSRQTSQPLNWVHDMCGKLHYINTDRADKRCEPCPKATFNPPFDKQNECVKISSYKCHAGSYFDIIIATAADSMQVCTQCLQGAFTDVVGQSKCTRCPTGKFTNTSGSTACTMCEGHVNGSSTLFQGAVSSDDCVCLAGSYNGEQLLGQKACVKCTEGQNCKEGGLAMPSQAEGYYIDKLVPDAVYLCEPKEVCIGAKWGESVCLPPRLGFLCQECPDGMGLNSNILGNDQDGCVKCSDFTTGIVALAPFIAFAFTLLIMYQTHKNPIDENPVMLEAQNSLGQLIMFSQVVNACLATGMLYGNPMASLSNSVLAELDPNNIFINSPCIATAFGTPVLQYGITIAAPAVLIFCLFITYIASQFCCKGIFQYNGLLNVVGEVLVEFYIAITLAIFAPFDCYGHPNGKQSVVSYPGVICGESTHGLLAGLAILGILAYPVPAMVVSLFSTYQYPRSLMKNDVCLLIRCRFLFERFRPECYWFCNVTIFRNFLIAVLPKVMSEGELDVTVLLMLVALIVGLVLSVWYKPRRSPQQNYLDAFVSVVQALVLAFGIPSVTKTALSDGLSGACVALIASVVLAVCAMIGWKLYLRVSGTVSNSIYLCHHSGAGGTAARFLHGILCQCVRGTVWYDIDNKEHLGVTLDAIKVSKNLLVVFGSATLCRPWCIGAIACAYRRGISLYSVIFTDPSPKETTLNLESEMGIVKTFSGMLDAKDATFEVDTFTLRGYGIVQEEVHPAVSALTQVEPVFLNFRDGNNVTAQLETLLASMADGSVVASIPMATVIAGLFSSNARLAQYKDGSGSGALNKLEDKINLILCDTRDGEAVAASRIFQSIFSSPSAMKVISAPGYWLEDQDLTSPDYATIVQAGKPSNCVILLTEASHKSASQLARLGFLVKCHPEMHMVPVGIGVTFDFPSQEFLTRLETGKVLDLGTNPAQRLVTLAGDEVNLKQISAGLVHVVSFLITFVNIPQLKHTELNQAVLDNLSRATGSGRRTSLSKLPPQQTPEAMESPTPVEEDNVNAVNTPEGFESV